MQNIHLFLLAVTLSIRRVPFLRLTVYKLRLKIDIKLKLTNNYCSGMRLDAVCVPSMSMSTPVASLRKNFKNTN